MTWPFAIARRCQARVLTPFGFDSFGLPAENAAIKTGTHPRVFTEARILELKSSLTRLGAVYDWRREVRSHDPSYMKCTHTIFLRLWKAGLAYRATAPVNWCPGCQTVLANEQVLADGTCERSGDMVYRRYLEQWFFRITDYADELLTDLDQLDWPERVKTMQRHWIGRSEGAEFDLVVDGRPDLSLRVFTTRPDTSFGMTYAVVAPEHPLLDALTTEAHRGAVEEVRDRAAHATDMERTAVGDSGCPRASGVPSPGATCATRSTGAPCRSTWPTMCSWATAPVPSWPCRPRTSATGPSPPCTTSPSCARCSPHPAGRPTGARRTPVRGKKINSDFLNGLDIATAKARAIEWLEEQRIGERKVNPRLARLVGVTAALLGLSDSGGVLPGTRGGARARKRAPGRGAGRRGVPPHRPVAAGPP